MSETGKLNIPYPVIVEGKYDRLRLISVINARIYTTDGFGVFSKSEKLTLLRALAEKTPVIVLTDSDGAGSLIRSHITSALPKEKLIQLYIPRIKGKEKRKAEPSKAGTIGVEGMERDLLYSIFEPFAVENGKGEDGTDAYFRSLENPLSKADFYRDGLSGREDSAAARDRLSARLGLPEGMTANSLLAAVKLLITYDEYNDIMSELNK
ncbi:MAG: DUF4093 domain-containing protein [Clostridia bacterium]|nr:DUF4093 domain-containing protein [Clostridia bacterium]